MAGVPDPGEHDRSQPETAAGLFVKCHRSYLCSLLHIHHIEKTTLTLDNRQQVPVSRQMYAKVNDAFIHYYKSARESRL